MDSFLVATKIIPEIASVHIQEGSWRPDFCDRAKLPRADLEIRASHIGELLCHTLAQCEQTIRPVAEVNKEVRRLEPTETKVNILD